MTDLSDQPIVIFRGDKARYSTDRLRDFLHRAARTIRCGGDLAKEVGSVLKEIGARRFRARMFQACHGVSSDEWNAQFFRFVADRTLGASNVGDQCPLRGELIEKLEYVSDRSSQYYKVRGH